MKRYLYILTLPFFLVSFSAAAQTDTDSAEPAPEAAPSSDADQMAEMQEQLDAVQKSMAEQHRLHSEEMASSKEEISVLQEQVETINAEREEELMAAAQADFEPEFRVYGFFDLTYAKNWYDKHSPWNEFVTPHNSFMMTSFNLYFSSQMTETLSALAELKFTFLPLGGPLKSVTGAQLDDEVYLYYTDGSDTLHWGTAKRVDTTVMDPFTTGTYKLGGVAIERIHLDWSPRDWFSVIAGRFLTPYGIWNVDHGSPVIMTARLPYMMIREMVPTSQTGVQIYGRFFPRDDFFFDYAVTASNGRGTVESMYDLDGNKGLGLRLGLSYMGDKVKAAVGGYGYFGSYSDKVSVKHFVLSDEGTIDENYDGTSAAIDNSMEIHQELKEQYDEVIATADLKLEFFGILLQSEYVWRRVEYSNTGTLALNESMFAGVVPAEQDSSYRHSSFIGQSVYGLLGYTLPLKISVSITPYIMYEYNTSNDTQPYINMQYYIAGVNVKPSPFVTLKLEGNIINPENDFYGDNLKSLMIQTAVSF